MSAKTNSGVRLDSEAMTEVAGAISSFLAAFEECRQQYNAGAAKYRAEGMFEGGTVAGVDLNEKLQEVFKTCDGCFDDNMEKLQKFANAIRSLAEQLGVNTSTLDKQISELGDNIKKKVNDGKNASAN